jgi:uncharacterized protein involved in exopolysaccharide biosynthesis
LRTVACGCAVLQAHVAELSSRLLDAEVQRDTAAARAEQQQQQREGVDATQLTSDRVHNPDRVEDVDGVVARQARRIRELEDLVRRVLWRHHQCSR